MKIVWWTVASPFAPTGYGRVTYYMAKELEKMGHEVHIFCANGLSHGRFTIDGLRLYGNPAPGSMGTETGVQLFNDLKADIAIYMGDFWPYAETVKRLCKQIPMILYSPIDHFPVTESECCVIRESRMLATMSQCGARWVREAGCENVMYAPHGVNLDIYRPGNRQAARQALDWPQDKFIYLTVATNKGDRKNHHGLLRAYSNLLIRRPELKEKTMLAMHTYPYRDQTNPEGYDLFDVALSLGLHKNILWADPLQYIAGVPESQLVLMYQACNCHVLASKTEGFGLPLIEAGACGIPSITTRFASMDEIVGNSGWLIDVADMEVQQLVGYSWQSVPSTDSLSALMEEVHGLSGPDFDTYRRRAADMHHKVISEFTWEKAASYWPAILEAAMKAEKCPTA